MMMRMDEREEEEEEKTSECSSGCQSGWTMYLDQSNEKLNSLPYHNKALSTEEEEDEEEEDLSMVSDASSGPPHFHEEDQERCYCRNGCSCSASSLLPWHAFVDNAGKIKRIRVEADTASSSLLDDTASSATTTTTSNNNKNVTREELSCGFSATHFKERHFKGRPAATRLHLGHLQTSTPAKPYSVCREEAKMTGSIPPSYVKENKRRSFCMDL